MARQRRLLGTIDGFEAPDNRAHVAEALAAAYPESRHYDQEEVAAFWGVAAYLDELDLTMLRAFLHERRIRIPLLIQDDPYRISRYLMSRWKEPEFRRVLITIPYLHPGRLAALAERNDLNELAEMVVANGFLPGLWALYRAGLQDRLEEVLAHMAPADRTMFDQMMVACRAMMHRYITEPFLLRTLTLKERKSRLRRLRGRSVRMRAMRRSIYGLDQERHAIVAQTRQAERQALAELDRLAARAEQVREQLAEAERLHAAALDQQASRFARELTDLRTAKAALQQEFALAIGERSAWAPSRFLQGLTVAVVGDEGRAEGYSALVESAGGRFVQASALEKLNRVPDVVAGADVVILVTAHAKHAAERRLRKAARPGALIVRCPKAGVGALERVLQSEVLSQIVAKKQVAAGGDRYDGGR